MTYQVHIKKNVIKILAQTNEPQYSALKKAIYDLAENHDLLGIKNCETVKASDTSWKL